MLWSGGRSFGPKPTGYLYCCFSHKQKIQEDASPTVEIPPFVLRARSLHPQLCLSEGDCPAGDSGMWPDKSLFASAGCGGGAGGLCGLLFSLMILNDHSLVVHWCYAVYFLHLCWYLKRMLLEPKG